jgi:PAS domain S-box-containing protein
MSGKKKSEELYTDSDFLQILLDTIPSPVFYHDAKGLFLGCNKALEEYLGLDRDHILGRSLYDLASTETADKHRLVDREVLNGAGPQTREISEKCADGRVRELILNKTLFYNGGRKAAGVIGVMVDITGLKKAEEILRQRELLSSVGMASFSAHIAILDVDGTILATNIAWRAFAQLNGLGEYRFTGVNYLSICDKASRQGTVDAAAVADGIRAVISGRAKKFSREYPCHSPTENRWFRMHVNPLGTEFPCRVAIAHEDITRQKLAEEEHRRAHGELELRVLERTEELARANEELRAEIAERRKAQEKISLQNAFLNHVLASLTHPFYVLDANDYTIKMANSPVGPDGVPPGTTCYGLSHRRGSPCDGSEHLCPLQLVKESRQPVTVEHIHYDRDGNLKNVEVHAYPIFDNEGNVEQIIEYSLDITERRRMEDELRKTAEKIKFFAYAVSHDLRSPLVAINGLTRLLWKQYRKHFDEKGRKYCEQILKASEGVLSLVGDINSYVKAKETPLAIECIDTGEILCMLREEFGVTLSSRRIRWSQHDAIPSIRADKTSMVRIFRNLIDNALKYGGETLTEIHFGYKESREFHVFSVSDDGVGIQEHECDRIFELFQRNQTSRRIDGTGLGLAIVKEIAERHRGKVWVESEPNRGATFYFSISRIL